MNTENTNRHADEVQDSERVALYKEVPIDILIERALNKARHVGQLIMIEETTSEERLNLIRDIGEIKFVLLQRYWGN